MRPSYNWSLFRIEFLGGVNITEWTLNNRCVYHRCLLYCRKYGGESNRHTALFFELPSYCLDHVSAFSLVTPGITHCSGNCLDTKKQLFSVYYCLMYHLHCEYTPMVMITAAGRGEDGSMILFSRCLIPTLNFFISPCFCLQGAQPSNQPAACWLEHGVGFRKGRWPITSRAGNPSTQTDTAGLHSCQNAAIKTETNIAGSEWCITTLLQSYSLFFHLALLFTYFLF